MKVNYSVEVQIKFGGLWPTSASEGRMLSPLGDGGTA